MEKDILLSNYKVCDGDCFRCKFDDCINDEMIYSDYKESNDRDKTVKSNPKDEERRRKAREKERERYWRDPEKSREKNRKYWAANREKLNAKKREWYKEHRDERAAYMKELNARARFELLRDQWKL